MNTWGCCWTGGLPSEVRCDAARQVHRMGQSLWCVVLGVRRSSEVFTALLEGGSALQAAASSPARLSGVSASGAAGLAALSEDNTQLCFLPVTGDWVWLVKGLPTDVQPGLKAATKSGDGRVLEHTGTCLNLPELLARRPSFTACALLMRYMPLAARVLIGSLFRVNAHTQKSEACRDRLPGHHMKPPNWYGESSRHFVSWHRVLPSSAGHKHDA